MSAPWWPGASGNAPISTLRGRCRPGTRTRTSRWTWRRWRTTAAGASSMGWARTGAAGRIRCTRSSWRARPSASAGIARDRVDEALVLDEVRDVSIGDEGVLVVVVGDLPRKPYLVNGVANGRSGRGTCACPGRRWAGCSRAAASPSSRSSAGGPCGARGCAPRSESRPRRDGKGTTDFLVLYNDGDDYAEAVTFEVASQGEATPRVLADGLPLTRLGPGSEARYTVARSMSTGAVVDVTLRWREPDGREREEAETVSLVR